MTTFIFPNDLLVIENKQEIILRKGVLHKHEIIIDKEKSSSLFVKDFAQFMINKKIIIEENQEDYDDFCKPSQFNLISIEIKNSKDNVLFVNDTLFSFFNKYLKDRAVIKKISDILNRETIVKVNENKDKIALDQIMDKFEQSLSDYGHVYLIDSFFYMTRLRAFNRVMKELKKVNTIAVFDNENILITCIKHGVTGCYQCLEDNIISRFEGRANDYQIKEWDYFNLSEAAYILSIINKELENVEIYGSSSLLGNVMHFYIPNYEYSFNKNRIQSSCSVCSGMENVLFAEQNIRSINVLKELMKHD
ncbi:bacteriocin biosynthesis cyclodehydratase [Heyndrickxia coagulans]|uniref:bacteriocin biosynthesis cyclodehydratase n=1 Tax=Heyndrickxia coagulans TaxID=1398 RepID=UPI0018A6DC68|nr:bacteriocin biosynthesis cyclodehydratase [Heyndrickxia coagulans]MBF8418016.1 bacteriocin biosynthesis cyclodehydratase [Heyndrickxia coagulans]